jgi:hypothetical protein
MCCFSWPGCARVEWFASFSETNLHCRNNDVCPASSDNDDSAARTGHDDAAARSNNDHHGRRTTVKPSFIFCLLGCSNLVVPNSINSLADVMFPRVGTAVGRAGCVDSFSRALFAVSLLSQ